MTESVTDLAHSVCFWSGVSSWIIAQCAKMVNGFFRTRRLDFRYFVSTGGMPSAHSSTVTGLATAVGLAEGFGSPLFAVALALAFIVMFDASTVRRAAGLQASLLNEIIAELFKEHRLSERKLKELLGHTRLEVFMGATIGVLTALLVVSLPWWP
ncbi:MAG: divergent PAP2 family protein [Verrucomicrobia bacterium]|nr:divergent PAP2 family protein [Verrucomicrobiota bacterium]